MQRILPTYRIQNNAASKSFVVPNEGTPAGGSKSSTGGQQTGPFEGVPAARLPWVKSGIEVPFPSAILRRVRRVESAGAKKQAPTGYGNARVEPNEYPGEDFSALLHWFN